MKNRLHIVITGERDAPRSYVIAKASLLSWGISSLSLVLLLAFFSFIGLKHSAQNGQLEAALDKTKQDLQVAQKWNQGIENRLVSQIAKKEAVFQGILDDLKVKNSEREKLFNTAVNELKNRSAIFDSILKSVGIKSAIKENAQHSGGPFTPLAEDSYEDLIFKFDHSLDIIKSVPLGAPVLGSITSLYGRRIDPINNEVAFHSGIDISKKAGAQIICPAAGKVIEKGYTGGLGNYVVLYHGQGFKTRYFHMQKSLVEKGAQLKRGEVIGLVGNTGRSTGSHLHYEILHDDKSVNPLKFVRVGRNM